MAELDDDGRHLSEPALHDLWGQRWQRFLDDFDAGVDSAAVPELLRDKVKNGNAERAIAGGHEGREVLELLQNARDAIGPGTTDGRVYIGVYEEGVLVANTGSPFDLFDTEVEDAVTMIGESAKGHSDEEIGHKGVGLKSILATGEAFEIWSRHETATDNLLRVRLSRAYITAKLLDILGCDSAHVERYRERPHDMLGSRVSPGSDSSRVEPLESDAREAIGKLPLFDFPLPLPTAGTADSPVAQQAKELVTGDAGAWYGSAFRTAVFIDYEDEAWTELLNAFDIPKPDPAGRTPAERAEQLWTYLAHGAGEHELTAETLVQFGGIGTVLLERQHSDGTHERERRTVDRSPNELSGTSLQYETVTVTAETPERTLATEEFDAFQFEDPDTNVQLLVPRDITDRDQPPSYPLYLYYPIENTRDAGLPFSLHGHFVVETNRKDLSVNSLDTNQDTLQRGIELLGAVADAACTHDLGSQYPWALLPPPPETAPAEPSTQATMLTWFRAQVFEELQDRACVPVQGQTTADHEAATPETTLLHWKQSIRAGYHALYAVDDEISPRTPAATSLQFPTETTLAGSIHLSQWDARIKRLLDVDDTEAFATEIGQAWAAVLETSIARESLTDSPAHIPCDATVARRLFRGTVEIVAQSGTDEDELRATLSTLTGSLESVYLLPCQHIDGQDSLDQSVADDNGESGGDEETLLLVPVESRTGGGAQQRGVQRTRAVLWDILTSDQDTEPPDVPSESSSYRVYFFDRVMEQDERARRVLELAGEPWGVRQYDGTPSYFRDLLDTFATPEETRVKPLDFHFLATQIQKIGDRSTDLQSHEGGFLPLSYLETAVATTDGDQRQNLRRRINLRSSQLQLPEDGGIHQFESTVLSEDWQRLRAEAIDTETDGWEPIATDELTTWPSPETAPWGAFDKAMDSETSFQQLAQTLSLFGSSVFPGIRVVWMYGRGHPRPSGNIGWNPADWDASDFTGLADRPDKTDALEETLAETPGAYREWLIAPGRHPQTSAEHSNKCPVKTDGRLSDVYLASWVWLEETDPLYALGEAGLCELLRRYETNLTDSLLRTGWTCSEGHQRDGYGWSDTVPTLFNWQLRQLTLWESLVTTPDALQQQWGPDSDRLSYAVLKTGSRGARPARLFPHIEADESSLSPDILATLGVKPIEAFDVTEAAWHFQRLLEVLATEPLEPPADPDTDQDESLQDPVPIAIPDGRANDWNAAYTSLLRPILEYLPSDDATMEDLNLSFLTHLPIQQNGEWAVASLDWLQDHAASGRYYEDQSPKPWERREIEARDYWLLSHPRSGPFQRLTDAVGIDPVDASKPVFAPDDLEFVEQPVDTLQSDLANRRALIIASLEQSSEEEIRDFAQKLERATADLRIAASFPEGPELEALHDSQSGLYAPRDGEEAFVLNAAAFEEVPTLDGLATAVGLLAEQPTKVPVFREVLSPGLTPAQLEDRWRQAFPLEEVTRILGTQRRQRLERRLSALTDLCDRLGGSIVVSPEAVGETIEQTETLDIDTVSEALCSGDTSSLEVDSETAPIRFIQQLHETLPAELAFVSERLFGSNREPWPTLLATATLETETEQTVIDWLDAHASDLDAAGCFPHSVQATHDRVVRIRDVWERTTTEELTDIEVWVSQLDSLSTDHAIDWASPLPPQLQADSARGSSLFYYTPDQQYQSLVVSPFIESIEADLPDDEAGIGEALREYIETGSFPVESATDSAMNFQDSALAHLQDNADTNFTTEHILDGEFTVGTAAARTTGNNNGSGGSSQFTGRGQQAEAATLVAILNDTAAWLTADVGHTIRTVRSAFGRLRETEAKHEYIWHVDSAWEQQLSPLLSQNLLTEEAVVNWREEIDGGRLRDHPLVRLCNVALERGPGFDVIDPFGSLSGPREEIDHEQFLPFEVKAVNGTTGPFDFRLTTNEYKRAKAFARADRDYAIRLVYVPPADHPNWAAETRFVSETVFETPRDVDALVEGAPFEDVVKGGYMNMRLSD